MEFESYSIKREADNSDVKLIDLDPLVCKGLNLEFSDKDFGHFYFTETEDEMECDQKSISWAGLLHVIAYYSKIKYGRCDIYDVEAAMSWVRQYAVTFPPSIMEFTSRLMKFLSEESLYMFVDLLHKKGIKNEFTCDYDGHRIYRNEYGIFECFGAFNLEKFYPDNRNILEHQVINKKYCNSKWDTFYSPSVRSLIIPDGIRTITPDFFNGGYVERSIILPDSLVVLEGFNDSYIREITIPASLKKVGAIAFRKSNIEVLFLDLIEGCEFNEFAFSDSFIEKLYVSRYEKERCEELPFIGQVLNIITY
ncbi:MAG: leucine-rich repeat domain-containing protein [Muribaculaceae bacterium]|nr:leucine-rich repeat domain-containing protein [Muribaculaceae bacterium]